MGLEVKSTDFGSGKASGRVGFVALGLVWISCLTSSGESGKRSLNSAAKHNPQLSGLVLIDRRNSMASRCCKCPKTLKIASMRQSEGLYTPRF
jgi:hypothetical protein